MLVTSPAPQAALSAPRGNKAELRLQRAIEALILALLAGLLGRRPRLTGAWHPLDPTPTIHATPHLRGPHDGTHLVCESPLLYVIGPGPNRGMRPRARTHPIPRPPTARAPPPRPSPIRQNTPRPGTPTHARFHFDIIIN